MNKTPHTAFQHMTQSGLMVGLALFGWCALGIQPGIANEVPAQRFSDPGSELGAIVDACIQPVMADYDISGVAVAVVAEGEIAYEHGYGVKHRDEGGAVDEHTLFRHGSVDKMLTAAAILRLVDQGLVDLNDRVIEYVPELHFAPGPWTADQILVRHLIENTAAIPSFRSSPEGSLSDWVETLDEVYLLGKPGAFFNYSNSNFALADLVVERASGLAFYDYMAAEIYRPAGMNDSTRYPSEAVASGNYTFGHADDGTIYAPDDYQWFADGFISAHDLAVWERLMLTGGGDVLSGHSCESAQSPQTPLYHYGGRPVPIGGGAYGYGLFVGDYPSAEVVWHGGGIPGWVANATWVPAERFAVAMLANSWPNAFNGLWEAVECITESAIGVTMPDMSHPSDPGTWPRYTGVYDAMFEDGFRFEAAVELDGENLSMTVPNPQNPDETITRVLENLHHSTFRFWENQNSWWDMTFISEPGKPAPMRWLRNQRFVGLRRTDPRRAAGRTP